MADDVIAPTTSLPRLAIYWTIVLVPLAWGVFQSVVKSLPLLHPPPPASAISAGE